MELLFEKPIILAAPAWKVITFEADIANVATSDLLWEELESEASALRGSYELGSINKRPAIAATRAAYKALGKDPNRYRPSAEALCRRLVKGMPLYRTLAAIDLINLISVKWGYSIGGFDSDMIQGSKLILGVGREGEEFEAIGRGQLNIAGLPVYRDAAGGIGTPTSDHERTKLGPDTTRLLMVVNIYDGANPGITFSDEVERLLTTHCSSSSITKKHYNITNNITHQS